MSPGVDCATAPAYAAAVRDVRSHSVAALTFLVWQAILTFDEEVEYIWPMHNKNPFKWVYMYMRYVTIAAHVIHNCLMGELTNGSNPPLLCDMWRAYIICFTQSLATLLEFLLAVRVFALYNRSRRVALLLLILMLTEIGGTLSNGSMDQTILGFAVHCTLIGLTLFKYIATFRVGFGRTPLASLVIRDGSTVYATKIFTLVSVGLVFSLEKERGVAVFFWATSLFSTMGRYLVVSMERFGRRKVTVVPPEPALTSEFIMEIDDSDHR